MVELLAILLQLELSTKSVFKSFLSFFQLLYCIFIFNLSSLFFKSFSTFFPLVKAVFVDRLFASQ